MLAEIARELEQLSKLDDLWTRALEALSRRGFPFVIYNTVGAGFSDPFVLTNVPDIYATVDPATDPFLSHCCESYDITPTGPAFLPAYEYLPDAAKAFITAAASTGFRTGLGIPMRLVGSERFGGFNLGTPLDTAEFTTRLMPRAEELRFFCLLIHRRIEELATEPVEQVPAAFRNLLVAPPVPQLDILSPREKEVIYLVARGISRKECARLCGISPHTIAEYTKSAYRKLGVTNRAEAAAVVLDGRAQARRA